MLPRLVLAFLLALPFSLPALVPALNAEEQSYLIVRMQTSVGGLVQIYFDTGAGFNGGQVVHLPIKPSPQAAEYRAPMPAGVYRAIRIDPGDAEGRYVIEDVRIVNIAGNTIATIPLAEIKPVYHLIEAERTAARLVVETTRGAYDPMLLYEPASPFPLLPGAPPLGRQLARCAIYIGVAFVALLGLERLLRAPAARLSPRLALLGSWGAAHPAATVFIVATVATFIATYPVLFFERSFVTPNNGGTLMLYDQAPYVPGGAEFEIEDARGNDVGAMMWAFVPYSKIQREALARGEFPLWNRYNGAGRTLWGQGQSFLFDPLHWLTLISPDPAAGWDLKFVAHRLVLAWGCGTAVLIATGAWLPAVVAAASAPFLGVFAYRFNHPACFALTYMPWVLSGWFLLARAVDRRRMARATLAIALASSLMLLASPPKESALLLAVTELTGFMAVIAAGGGWRLLRERLAAALAAGTIFLLVTTPHWLMFLEALGKAGTASDTPSIGIAAPAHLRAFVLGPLMPGGWFVSAHLMVLVLGVALLLTPLALLRQRMLLATIAGGALLMTMAFGIIPEAWMLRMPLLPRIGHVYDIALAGAAVLAVIATASGIDSLRRASLIRAVLTTAALGAVTVWIARLVVDDVSLYRFEPWAVISVIAVAIALPLLVYSACRTPARVMPWIACVAAGLWIVLPGGQHLETGVTALDRILVQPRHRVSLDQDSPTVDAIHRDMPQPARAVGLNMALFSGSQALYQLEGIGGPDALWIQRYEQVVDAAGMQRPWIWLTILTPPELPTLDPLLDLLNVGFLIGRPDALPRGYPQEPIAAPDLVRAVRRPTAWPRAFFADSVSTYAEPADLMQQVAARRTPLAAVQSADAAALEATRDLPSTPGTFVAAEDYALGTNSTAFRVRTPGAGVVVLTETYVPDDFVVTVNGQPTSYFRVNHAFKGVRIPGAGDWQIRFDYRPAHWRAAWLAAGLGALLAILVGIVALRPARALAPSPAGNRERSTPDWDAVAISRE